MVVGVGSAPTAALTPVVGSDPRVRLIQAARIDEAIDLLADRHVDLVLTALDLPDSRGLSTVQRLCDAADGRPVVAMLNGNDAGMDPDRVLAQGAVACLPSGMADPASVAAVIHGALHWHRSTVETRRRADRLEAALTGSGDGLWDIDLRQDELYLSAEASELIGFPASPRTEGGRLWYTQVHPDDRALLESRFRAHLDGAAKRFECEHRVVDPSGTTRWVLAKGVAARDLRGRVTRVSGTLTETTDQRRIQDELRHRALHDDLVDLPNRVLFVDRLERALVGLNRAGGAPFAVLFVDLDHFKNINDLYGHGGGDQLLVCVAERIVDVVRPGDTVSRLGGDEFGVLLAGVDRVGEAVHIAERILDRVNVPFTIGADDVVVTASVGIAMSATGYDDGESLLHDADVAMYRAKATGRARCQVFDPSMHEAAVRQLRLESELRDAVTRRQFEVHYQPVVDLRTGRVAGFEGLVRWRHPRRGLVTPTEFLAAAESSGLIVPIGWWAIREASRQLSEWRERVPEFDSVWVSVNASARVLLRAGVLPRLREICHDFDLPTGVLHIELKENLVMEHGPRAVRRLEELRTLGIRLCFDDFGTGCSSLGHLDEFRYDVLKIDPSLVWRVGDGGRREDLLRSMVALAQGLGMEAVAEGVETREQAEALMAMNCPLAQGHWLSLPVTADQAVEFVRRPAEHWALH